MNWELQNKIVDRQLAVRREEYEDILRQNMGESTEAARFKTTCIANYFSYCDYSRNNLKWIPFCKERDKVKITIRHDVPEESLRKADFRASNTYGYRLLQDRIGQCGGSLTREALADELDQFSFYALPAKLP